MATAPAPSGETPNPTTGETPEVKQEAVKEPTAAELAASLADMRKALKDSNRENAERRKKLEAYETADAERKQAEMTAEQKLTKQLADANEKAAQAQANANERIITAELRAQAAAMGFTDLDYAVFKVRPKVTLTEDGAVEGADEALKELAKSNQALIKKQGQAPLNSGNPGQAQNGETPAQARARLFGAGQSIFDRGASDQLGGGVFMSADNPKQQP